MRASKYVSVDDLITTLDKLLSRSRMLLLAIDGYGGAGKTTLAKQIQESFAGAPIVCLDDFATDTVSGADRARFLAEVLQPLRSGSAAEYRKFKWRERKLGDPVSVQPEGLIIIEGVSVTGVDFHPYYDLRVWIDCPLEIAGARMIERDTALGLSHATYFNVWLKEDNDYALTEPWKRVDYLIRCD